ncbi:hypothetical protein SASPL_101582 [Salvia splendens]|uniref:Solute carrier family 35, member F1/2 n=1 Tax=Salvia splendens TaxID=180675 RepID=A0A8X8YPM8_SALSN|nr:hypothetical protein SASPL_101582 [Salvia splendens]
MRGIKENLDKNWRKNAFLRALGLGQLLSLLITATGFASSELAKKGINAPTSQSFFNYVLLALVYGSIMLYRRQALKAKWYYYILLGAVDVEANFLGKTSSDATLLVRFGVTVVKAYQYTSITSVMLLDCWTIPCVLFLTWFFLKTKYRFKKLAGVVICVAGLVVVVFSDVHSADRSSGSNPIKGDLLVLAGATLYGVTNVGEGFYVLIFTAISLTMCCSVILERDELRSIHWTAGATFPFVGFSVAMFLFYSGVPILLKISGSTMLNLSLLTSDMWAVLIRIFAYQEKVDWMYFVAFAAVTLGLIVYSGGNKIDQNTAEVADEEAGAGCSENRDAVGSSKAGRGYGRKQDGSSSSAAGEGGAEKSWVS